jgi:hypothetical protein
MRMRLHIPQLLRGLSFTSSSVTGGKENKALGDGFFKGLLIIDEIPQQPSG